MAGRLMRILTRNFWIYWLRNHLTLEHPMNLTTERLEHHRSNESGFQERDAMPETIVDANAADEDDTSLWCKPMFLKVERHHTLLYFVAFK